MCDEIEVAWAAGLLEGEGSFVKRHVHSSAITCSSTDLDTLEKLASIFGGNIVKLKKRKSHWKDAWAWYVSGQKAYNVMGKILPFMMCRRSKQIVVVMKRWEKHNAAIMSRKQTGQAAVAYYKSMTKPSLRKAGAKYGISYESVRRALKT